MWALLPLKSFDEAKQRLSGVLTSQERRNLFQVMVEDVLNVLHDHPQIRGTLLISEDPLAQIIADRYQVDHLRESSLCEPGLNNAVQAGVAFLNAKGIDDVMVVHGDLPEINASEISELIECHKQVTTPALTIAPDSHLKGSNCLLCRPASTLTYCYGNQSLKAHSKQSQLKGLKLNIKALKGISRDLDTPADLYQLINNFPHKISTKTHHFLVDSGISERIKLMFQLQNTESIKVQ